MSGEPRPQAVDATAEQALRAKDPEVQTLARRQLRIPTLASPYLTSWELVDYLKLPSLSALYTLIREHGLPVCHVGGRLRGDVRDIDPWVHQADAVDWARTQRKRA